jgi:hypothetical protein
MNGSTSVRFTEEMKGHISFGDKDYERGAREGRNDSTTLMFRLTVEDLDLFCEVIGRLLIQEKGPDRTSGEPDLWFDLGVSMGIERPHSKLSSPPIPAPTDYRDTNPVDHLSLVLSPSETKVGRYAREPPLLPAE